jgi:uncharacterized phage protein (TIGR02220 family)
MATRMLRPGIWDSEKFNNLTSDTVRLCFIRLISEQDDLGNLEGNIFKLYRLWRDFDGVTSIEKATSILEQLVEKQLILLYKANDDSLEEKNYLHIPNHRQRVRYFKRLYPISPFQLEDELNKINNLKEKKTGLSNTQDTLKADLNRIDIDIDTDIDNNKNHSLAKAKPIIKSEDVKEILIFLNEKANRHFPIFTPNGKPTRNFDLVKGLLKQGYDKADIKSVIAKKNREWSSNEKMSVYIRPATLFGKKNFEQYLGELKEVKQ